MPRVREWLIEADPDLVAIQETKVEDDKFPHADLQDLGYNIYIHGQKSYNGVAFFSKKPLENVEVGFGHPDWPTDARIIRATLDGVLIINTYVPNGTAVGSEKWAYKLAWLDNFRPWLESLAKPTDKVIWLGDINIAPTELDVYEAERHLGNVGHHPDEFERLKKIIDWGFTDTFRQLDPSPDNYTFWDFRIPNSVARNLGWRIDHIYASESMKDKVSRVWCDIEARKKERPSDHAPLLADIDWS